MPQTWIIIQKKDLEGMPQSENKKDLEEMPQIPKKSLGKIPPTQNDWGEVG